MKKLLTLAILSVVLQMASFASAAVLSSKSYDSQVTFKLQGSAPSFDVYGASTGGTPITDLNFGNQTTDTVGSDKRISIAQRYVAVTPGDAKWSLIIYTKNTLAAPDNDANLYWDNDAKVKMIWKYRNAIASGVDATAVGSTISATDWSDVNLAKYRYFLNAPSGSVQLSSGDKLFATIASYTDVATINALGRIQVVFGVDLKSTYLHGLYKTKVGFELYTN